MAQDIVTSIKVEINAPASLVWEVLVDLDSYPQWNPYTVRVASALDMGGSVDLYLPHPGKPGETLHQREYLLAFAPGQLLSWGMKWLHPWVLGARRDQHLQSLGEARCSYYTTDSFRGVLTGSVMRQHGAWIKQGFDGVAHSLKQRAEALYARQSAAPAAIAG